MAICHCTYSAAAAMLFALAAAMFFAVIVSRPKNQSDNFRPENNLSMSSGDGPDDTRDDPVVGPVPPMRYSRRPARGCIGCGTSPCDQICCSPRKVYTPPPRPPPPPPCKGPVMAPPCPTPCLSCDSGGKARGEQRCPSDICRNWCWSPATVEQAEGLTAANAIGFEPDIAGYDSGLRGVFDTI